MTVSTFSDGRKFVSGNRCERGAGLEITKTTLPNLYEEKMKMLFDYKSLKEEEAPRGTVGIPRVLNLFENYPYWHTFFTELGFKVVLSPKSSKKLFEAGIETIPSESVCYPAKLVHGHIAKLIDRKVDFIFYPSVPYEVKEDVDADNHYNCPIVTSYPETIKHNTDRLDEEQIRLMSPFLPMDEPERLAGRLVEEFSFMDISSEEITSAAAKAWDEKMAFRARIRRRGEEVVKQLKEKNLKGIVLAGRPYHVDQEINHGLTHIVTSLEWRS